MQTLKDSELRYRRLFEAAQNGILILDAETVMLSLGVAIFPQDGATSAAMLRAVDATLYRAKGAGCGRVVMAN
jgi:GGDEF domain-containing protein